jgi:RNA polymerase sigma-70 factor (ECF subfamily)
MPQVIDNALCLIRHIDCTPIIYEICRAERGLYHGLEAKPGRRIISGATVATFVAALWRACMEEMTWSISNLQDRALISRSQNGDQVAFEDLVRKYQHQLSILVCWHAGRAADTDDILQLILCKVYFSLKSFDINRPFYPWLRRIAVNRCCDERRRLRRRRTLTFAELEIEETCMESEIPALRALAKAHYADNEQNLGDALRAVLKQLSDEHRKVLSLRHLQQISYEEIGEALKCTPRAARVKTCRARAALRRLILKASPSGTADAESLNHLQRLNARNRKNPSNELHSTRIPRMPAQSNSRRYIMKAE